MTDIEISMLYEGQTRIENKVDDLIRSVAAAALQQQKDCTLRHEPIAEKLQAISLRSAILWSAAVMIGSKLLNGIGMSDIVAMIKNL